MAWRRTVAKWNPRSNTLALCVTVLALAWRGASGQTVTVVHSVNLRPDPSSEYPPIRLLTPTEPPLTLLEPLPESGYYHVKTSAGEEGDRKSTRLNSSH